MPTQYTPIVVPMTASTTEETVPMTVSTTEETVDMTPSSIINVIANYERLTNKPQINGVELVGDKSAYDLGLAYKIKYDTSEGWANNVSYIPMEGELIIYTDIPAIKVGDGLAYAVDLPFVTDDMRDLFINHMQDAVVHVTQDDRDFWDNKVRCYISYDTLVFTTR